MVRQRNNSSSRLQLTAIAVKQTAGDYCMPHDDGRMTETYCVSNIGRGDEEELLR
jgi:hypothetical protein